MAPGNNGVAPQYSGGKKTNNKGTAMAKRKTGEESAQRRTGCPVLLESGCRIGKNLFVKFTGFGFEWETVLGTSAVVLGNEYPRDAGSFRAVFAIGSESSMDI